MPDLQTILDRLSLTQRGVARLLGRDERTMRRWIAGDREEPPELRLLLEAVAEIHRHTGETPAAIIRRLRRPAAPPSTT